MERLYKGGFIGFFDHIPDIIVHMKGICKNEGCDNPIRGLAFDICWYCSNQEKRRIYQREYKKRYYCKNKQEILKKQREWVRYGPNKKNINKKARK